MQRMLSFISYFILTLNIYAQYSSEAGKLSDEFYRGQGTNYPVTPWNKILGTSQIEIQSSSSSTSPMNNFVCDAILEITEADFSFINYGDISIDIYKGPITELDLVALCPYKRTLVIMEVNGAFLMNLVESKISDYCPGMAIGGGIVECDEERPANNKLTFFKIGEYPVYPKKDYRVVTTDYIAAGNAGFEVITALDSMKIIKTEILLRDAIRQYIIRHSPLGSNNVSSNGRWLKK